MKKILALLILVFLLPTVAAESYISGWFKFPAELGPEGFPVIVGDLSIGDGSILIYLGSESPSRMRVLPVGESILWDGHSFRFGSGVYVANAGYLNVSYEFPYLLVGERLLLGDYELLLKSVSEKGSVIVVSTGNESKELNCPSGKEVSYGNLRVSLTPMPVLFKGYLERGKGVKIGGWTVEFANYTVSSENEELTEIVRLLVNNEEYFLEPGDTVESDGLIIKVEDLVGSEYLRTTVILKGAYVHVRLLPDFEAWLKEDKTEKIGPYLIRVEKILDNSAYISIMNPCGRVLRSGFVHVGNFSSGIYYRGLSVGALGSRQRQGVMELHVVAFLDLERLPQVNEVALINVSFSAPQKVTQYVPFDINVTIVNEGPSDVRYLEIEPNISTSFKLLGDYVQYIPELKRGEIKRLSLRVLPEASGNATLGNIIVVGHVPYDLSCYGMESVQFSSETLKVEIIPVELDYSIGITASDGRVGEPLPVNVTVTNEGNAEIPFTLTVALPEGFASIAENFTSYGKWLVRKDKLKPKQTKNYSLLVVPQSPGEYEISVGIESHGRIFHNSTTVRVEGIPEGQTVGNSTVNETCEPKLITKVITVTVPSNETDETQTVLEGGIPLKQKLIYIAGSFFGGIAFILLLAWVAAKMEERG